MEFDLGDLNAFIAVARAKGFGPGYRVYYTERGGALIVLPAGGDKSSQAKDIKAAIAMAKSL